MKIKIATLTLLLVAQPAQACHRFSRWYYPYPQRCSNEIRQVAFVPEPIHKPPEFMEPIKPISPSPVEVSVAPTPKQPDIIIPALDNWDVIEHEAGVMKLKMLQGGYRE